MAIQIGYPISAFLVGCGCMLELVETGFIYCLLEVGLHEVGDETRSNLSHPREGTLISRQLSVQFGLLHEKRIEQAIKREWGEIYTRTCGAIGEDFVED
jgi:hypothetical protein